MYLHNPKKVVYKECVKLGVAITAGPLLFYYYFSQRELNRWSQFSEQKLFFFSKVKILKNTFNKNDGHIGFI